MGHTERGRSDERPVYDHQAVPGATSSVRRREDMRVTDDILTYLPGLVGSEHKRDMEEFVSLLKIIIRDMRVLTDAGSASNVDAADDILAETANGAYVALQLLKSLDDNERQVLAITSPNDDPNLRILGTVVGDLITVVEKFKNRLIARRATIQPGEFDNQMQLATQALLDAYELADVTGTSERVEDMAVEVVKEETSRASHTVSDDYDMPHALGSDNRRVRLRGVKIPDACWQGTLLAYRRVRDREEQLNNKTFRELWNEITLQAASYKLADEEVERLKTTIGGNPKGAIDERETILVHLLTDIRSFLTGLESLDIKSLRRLNATGMMGLLIGDMRTLLSVVDNVLAESGTPQETVQKRAMVQASVLRERERAIAIYRKSALANEIGIIPPAEKEIRETTGRALKEHLGDGEQAA